MDRKKILIPIIIFTIAVIVMIIVFNPSTKYTKLCVSENVWNSLKNSRRENNNLVLDDIEFNDYSLIIDKENNTLYYSVVNDSPNKYNPSVSYKVNNLNTKLVILADEITSEKVRSNHIYKIMIYTDNEYHIYDLKCTDLPIMNIQYEGSDIQKNNPMNIYVFNNLSNTPNRVTISDGKIKSIGNEFIISLNKTTPGKNKRENRISILNMKPDSEYILTETNTMQTNDKENDDKKIRENRVELFINNSYVGTYNLDYAQKRGNLPPEKGLM